MLPHGIRSSHLHRLFPVVQRQQRLERTGLQPRQQRVLGAAASSDIQRRRRPDAVVDSTFDAARAVEEDEERRLDDKNKIWFEERVAGLNEDDQILERVGGGRDGTLRL